MKTLKAALEDPRLIKSRIPRPRRSSREIREELQSSTLQRKKLNELAKLLNVKDLDGWYNTVRRTVRAMGGSSMLKFHSGSLSQCLRALYPNHDWKPWHFRSAPKNYWDEVSNQRKAFDDIAEIALVKTLDGWYDVTHHQIHSGAGGGIIRQYYNDSISTAVQALYPEHDWKKWKFRHSPMGYWQNSENQRKMFDYIGEKLDIKDVTGWFGVTHENILQFKIGGMINFHGGNLNRTLASVYPNFFEANKNALDALRSVRLINRVRKRFTVNALENWYRLSLRQLHDEGGSKLSDKLPNALQLAYPNYSWDWKKFKFSYKKSEQRVVLKCVKAIFPKKQILEEHVVGIRHATGEHLSVDVFVPEYSLAFEYQGQQHYHDNIFPEGMWVISREALDAEKMDLCSGLGISIVHIPYWWKGDTQTLRASINSVKPELKLDVDPNTKPFALKPEIVSERFSYNPMNPAHAVPC